ncbi:pentatricopeptide repeat-containing protein At5g66520-like [Amborella trichopoda]|uniref:pentatricopeptide repeat-containing protein At5g66520-like n=1 Tax=Amborella trichopoda TaxID=13333 RepID=UPI0009C02DAD|nr:pentatricopeptide repeat-containing protein At5g66520-like [Amborella trichopoda]|eukprot:XP_011624832.2 pentatricopeptide repeat-containing protein At5g66520-like [Amborella trichopoda]
MLNHAWHHLILSLPKKCSAIKQLLQIQAQITILGLIHHTPTLTTLIEALALLDFGRGLSEARHIFEHLTDPKLFIWNTMLRGYASSSNPKEALHLYNRMLRRNIFPDTFTYSFAIKACVPIRAFSKGEEIRCRALKSGLESSEFVRKAVVRLYVFCGEISVASEMFDEIQERDVVLETLMLDGLAKRGLLERARKLFDEMPQRNVISWGAMICGYVHNMHYDCSLEIFREMMGSGMVPSGFILSIVLRACASLGALDQGKWVHAYMGRHGVVMDVIVGTALVDMYAKCGCIALAEQIFVVMHNRNVLTWTAMIYGLAMHGYTERCLALFLEMERERVKPNELTFVAVLCACNHGGLVEEGRKLFGSMSRDHGIEPGLIHYGCMVDLLGRAGLIAEAMEVVKGMPMRPDGAILRALLGACRLHGNVGIGERVAEELFEVDNHYIGDYILLSNLYAMVGRWDGVLYLRERMRMKGVKKVPGLSCVEVDGHMHEFLVQNMT